MKKLRRLGMKVVLLGGGATRVAAQAYEASWWTVDAGGSQGQIGSTFAIDGAIGQPDAAGPVPGGAFEATSGFWSVVAGGSTGTAADLAVTISDSPDPVPAGALLTYTVEVRNLGPATSPALSLRDTLPPAATFVSSVPGPPVCVHLKGDVNCTFADVPAGVGRTVTIEVFVASWASGALTNTAVAIGGTPDPVPANNVDDETTAVIGRA